jgi:hypothetical protein
MICAKAFWKRALRLKHLCFTRAGHGHRFDAIEDLLLTPASRGFNPLYVIYGGVNIGQFSRLSRSVWEDAHIYNVELQQFHSATLKKIAQKLAE